MRHIKEKHGRERISLLGIAFKRERGGGEHKGIGCFSEIGVIVAFSGCSVSRGGMQLVVRCRQIVVHCCAVYGGFATRLHVMKAKAMPESDN